MHTVATCSSNVPCYLTKIDNNGKKVIKMLFGAKMADVNSLRDIPNTNRTISERCMQVAGFVPYYLLRVQHSNAKNAFTWAFLLRLNEGSAEVPLSLKHVSDTISLIVT